jgi:hypothetical protein
LTQAEEEEKTEEMCVEKVLTGRDTLWPGMEEKKRPYDGEQTYNIVPYAIQCPRTPIRMP